ncbi:MAG: hypothetical protein H6582_05530 [Crocinitomicaceae bacterium]|nr:hypothetical protein [Crocinitomicaceae bacterium]
MKRRLFIFSLSLISVVMISSCGEQESDTVDETIEEITIEEVPGQDSMPEVEVALIDSSKEYLVMLSSKKDQSAFLDWRLANQEQQPWEWFAQHPISVEQEYTIGHWKDYPNTINVRYVGNEFGDYFHLMFEDSLKEVYDFGFGDNDFSGLELYDEDTFEDNPKYLNKWFELSWEFKISAYPCCDGEYNSTIGLQPSITDLKLIK